MDDTLSNEGMPRLTPEQVLFLANRYKLNFELRIFGYNCYQPRGKASPNGTGSTIEEALLNWCNKLWNQPCERWFYNYERRAAIAKPIQPGRITSLEDLGL